MSAAPELLNFTTTLAGDTVLVSGKEFLVVQKLHHERRLRLRPTEGIQWERREQLMQEADYNRAGPVLVRGKGKA